MWPRAAGRRRGPDTPRAASSCLATASLNCSIPARPSSRSGNLPPSGCTMATRPRRASSQASAVCRVCNAWSSPTTRLCETPTLARVHGTRDPVHSGLAASLENPDRLGFPEAKTIVLCMRTNASVELDAGTKTFASGLLADLIAALRRSREGDLVAVVSGDPSIGPELEAWCRFTRNSLVDVAVEESRTRWVLRYGQAPEHVGEDRPVRSRL